MNLRCLLTTLCLVSLFVGAPLVHAQFTWTGGGTSGITTDGQNWGGSAPAGSGAENLTFGASGPQINVLVPTSAFNNITFTATTHPAYTFSGIGGTPVLTLNGNLTVGAGNPVLFNNTLGLNLTNNTVGNTFNIAAATTLQIDGVISGPGHFAKTGTGTLILTAANTFNYVGGGSFTNSTAINFGTVHLNAGAITHTGTGDITVGDSNGDNGTLLISNGGDASDYFGVIGQSTGSTGSATVTGAGSTWTNSNGFDVGYSGNGSLTISSGGAVSTLEGRIGTNAGSVSSATVTGTGSTWTNSAALLVGNSGSGTLNILAGADVTNTYSYIATQSGSSGTATVDGAGSTWTNSGLLAVGQGGTGTLAITNGGVVANTYGEIGYSAGSTGTVTVDGAGSTWTNANDVNVGNAGAGTLTLKNGGAINVTGGTGTVAVGAFGGTGTLNIGAPAASAAAAGGIVNAATINLGNGTLQFKTTATAGTPYYLTKDGTAGGAAVTVTGSGTLTNTAGYNVLTGANTYAGTTLNGGTLVVQAGSITHGSNSLSVGQSSGDNAALLVTGGGDITNLTGLIGNSAGSIGTATVTGAGSTWTNTNYLYVGTAGDGTLTVTTGGSVLSPNTSIGNNFGGTGYATVTGAGSSLVNSVNLYVGSEGEGQLDILSGGVVTNVDGRVGNNVGGAGGFVNVSGAGSTWTNTGTLIVGGASEGILEIIGQGTVTAASMTIGGQSSVNGQVELANPGSNLATSGNLLVGNNGDGGFRIISGSNATTGGFGVIGNNAGSTSSALVAGVNSTWNLTGELYVGNGGDGTLYLYDQAKINVGSGSGTVHLGHSTGGAGILRIGTDGEGIFAGGIINAAAITTGAGLSGELRFDTTATAASPYYLTKDGTAGGAPVLITGPTQVHQDNGYTVLNGANSHTGGTLIQGGTLVAGHNTALGTGSVTVSYGRLDVASGITLANSLVISNGTLGGNGSFGSSVSLGTGTHLAPGASPGTLTFASGLALSNGTFDFEVQSALGAAGTGYDTVNVTGGTLDFAGVSPGGYTLRLISLNGSGTPGAVADFSSANPYAWTVFGAANPPGSFNVNLFTIDTSSFTNTLGAGHFFVSQAGNNILLNFTPVPEPSTYMLMLMGLGFSSLTAWRKRRRA